jgi:hypothetical protein
MPETPGYYVPDELRQENVQPIQFEEYQPREEIKDLQTDIENVRKYNESIKKV